MPDLALPLFFDLGVPPGLVGLAVVALLIVIGRGGARSRRRCD